MHNELVGVDIPDTPEYLQYPVEDQNDCTFHIPRF